MSISQNIMNIIDEVKDLIPDQKYLEICAALSTIHHEQNTYLCTYVSPDIQQVTSEHFEITIKVSKCYVVLSNDDYKECQEFIAAHVLSRIPEKLMHQIPHHGTENTFITDCEGENTIDCSTYCRVISLDTI